jgi:hypothetical protein
MNQSWNSPVIDALIPQIEEARSEGAVVLLKWDGERAHNHCTVVVTRQESDYVWRQDSDDIASTLAEAMADYRANHAR